MGNEESKSNGESSGTSGGYPPANFPNFCKKDTAKAWNLLHQCTVQEWKEGHADAAGFRETVLNCDGHVNKDCSPAFCMSRQGIININKASSIFSFRKRCKFTKMAEHFEYNHIPAQLSSIQNFHVKSVLCYHDNLVVLHLVRNMMTQFGLLDLKKNKFLGIFGKQGAEFVNEVIKGEMSPDYAKCLIMIGLPSEKPTSIGGFSYVLKAYDLASRKLLSETSLNSRDCHFCFDPRFCSSRISITNYEENQDNSLSLVHTGAWDVIKSNHRVNDTMHGSLYPNMKDLKYMPDGSLIVATLVDPVCTCRDRKTRNYRPVNCSIYVFNADTVETLHCIQYERFTCGQHLCPVNFTPVFSVCGNRMAVVVDVTGMPGCHFVQVYKLPSMMNLQNLCRIAILQSFSQEEIPELLLPPKLINYLHFKPEYA
ncbi:uncharacterized protein LOC141904165 [Tubulanus polymorphus]|uniref:uncharacterized protein LOC141904165 n=1 Tax=Tubulanus polymorphus TaxID=672921 RepID=UPI003DA487DB